MEGAIVGLRELGAGNAPSISRVVKSTAERFEQLLESPDATNSVRQKVLVLKTSEFFI